MAYEQRDTEVTVRACPTTGHRGHRGGHREHRERRGASPEVTTCSAQQTREENDRGDGDRSSGVAAYSPRMSGHVADRNRGRSSGPDIHGGTRTRSALAGRADADFLFDHRRGRVRQPQATVARHENPIRHGGRRTTAIAGTADARTGNRTRVPARTGTRTRTREDGKEHEHEHEGTKRGMIGRPRRGARGAKR